MIPGKYPDKILANLIIAGVNKAGSTSLFHYLSAHPEVCGSKDKETCYFLPVLYNQSIPPISLYEAQFSHCKNTLYKLEATPGYVTGGEKMAEAIAGTLGSIKIIIILKEPVERLISFYKRKKATLQLPSGMSFSDFVNRCANMSTMELELQENHLYTAMATGKYSGFLEPWLKTFQQDIKIVFFDDLQKDVKQFMIELAGWLKIDSRFYEDFEFDVKNRSMNYKNELLQQMAVNVNRAGQRFWRAYPGFKKNLLSLYYKANGSSFAIDEIDNTTVQFLKNYYEPHNHNLQLLLSRFGINDKPSWLEQVKETA